MNYMNLFSFEYSFECVLLQFTILLLLLLLINCSNNYYSLLYLFLLILFLGAVLCLLNTELTAGFLWVGELLVVFVFLLLILYVNVNGDAVKASKKDYVFYVPLISLFVLLWEHDNTQLEDSLVFLQSDLYWVDYYEALNDDNLNDLYGFFLSYYEINNFILLVFGIILFFGSIICVVLFRTVKVIKFANIGDFFNTIKITQSFLYSLFIRKQDLFDQNSFSVSVKTIFSKND